MRERADWNINNIYPAVFITGDTAVPGTAVDQEQEDDEEDDGWIKTVRPLGLHWSPAEWSTAVIRDQVRDHDVNTPALLCHKEPARRILLEALELKILQLYIPYGGNLRSKVPSRWLRMRRAGSLWHT